MRNTAVIPELDSLQALRDTKRAEVTIARVLRGPLDDQQMAEVLVLRAQVRLLGGRLDEAFEDLRAAQELAPAVMDQPGTITIAADCHFARFELAPVGFADRSDTAAAHRLYTRVLSEFGQFDNTGWVLYQLARLRLIDGQALEAVDLLQKALLSPSRFAFLTAYCYERLGFIHLYEVRDLPQALNFLNKAVDTYPESERRTWLAQVHTLRSRVLRDQGKLDEALAAADFAVQIAAANGADGRVSMSDASLLAAELAAQIGGHDRDVVAYLNQFLQTSRKPGGIDVTWSRAHELLGDSLWRSANPQGALAAYESALQYNPYHPWELSLYYRMARCHYQMKDYARTTHALEHMFKIAERDGEAISDFRVYQLLANAYYASHNFADAEAAYERALSLAPQETDHIAELVHYMHLARGRAVGRAAPTL